MVPLILFTVLLVLRLRSSHCVEVEVSLGPNFQSKVVFGRNFNTDFNLLGDKLNRLCIEAENEIKNAKSIKTYTFHTDTFNMCESILLCTSFVCLELDDIVLHLGTAVTLSQNDGLAEDLIMYSFDTASKDVAYDYLFLNQIDPNNREMGNSAPEDVRLTFKNFNTSHHAEIEHARRHCYRKEHKVHVAFIEHDLPTICNTARVCSSSTKFCFTLSKQTLLFGNKYTRTFPSVALALSDTYSGPCFTIHDNDDISGKKLNATHSFFNTTVNHQHKPTAPTNITEQHQPKSTVPIHDELRRASIRTPLAFNLPGYRYCGPGTNKEMMDDLGGPIDDLGINIRP